MQMLPRLEAEEILNHTLAVGLGMGGGDSGKATIDKLQRQAKGEKLEVVQKMSGRQFAGLMGFKVKTKKKKVGA